MPRKTRNQKASASIKNSVQKFSSELEALSLQINNLTDAIISEKNANVSNVQRQRELFSRKMMIKNLQEDINELRSERIKNQNELEQLLRQEKEAESKQKEESNKKATQYSTEAEKAFEDKQFISGMIFKFLGRNEKSKEDIEKEKSKDRQEEISLLKERSKELSDQTKNLRDIRNEIVKLNTNLIEQQQDEEYNQQDEDSSRESFKMYKFMSVKLVDIDPVALTKLEKLLKNNAPQSSLISDAATISGFKLLEKGLISFLGSTVGLTGIAASLAGIAAYFSIQSKTNDYVKDEKERKQKEDQVVNKLNKKEIDEDQALQELNKNVSDANLSFQRLNAAVGDSTILYQDDYDLKKNKLKIQDEKAKEEYKDTTQVPTDILKQWIESDKKKLKSESDPDMKRVIEQRIKYNEVVMSGRVQKPTTVEKLTTPSAGKPPEIPMDLGVFDKILASLGSLATPSLGVPAYGRPTYKTQPIIKPSPTRTKYEDLFDKFVVSESAGKTDVINEIGAAGMYQFTQSTALDIIKRLSKERPDIAKKFEGKEILTREQIEKDTELQKLFKTNNQTKISEYIKTTYPSSVAATVASLPALEQKAMYQKYIQPLLTIKEKLGQEVTFGDVKAYGFASGKYPEALKSGNMQMPMYDFNTKEGAYTLSKNKFMKKWDTDGDGILTAQELYEGSSKLEPIAKRTNPGLVTNEPKINGGEIYTAAMNNKQMYNQPNNTAVVNAPQNININQQGTKEIRKQPDSTYHPLQSNLFSFLWNTRG